MGEIQRKEDMNVIGKKNEIIQLSFKNNCMEEQLLLEWIKDNSVITGKSAFIKAILFEKMKEQLQQQ